MNTLSSLLKFIANFEPLGSVKMYAGSTAPEKWLFCRGQAVSRTTYAKLFAVIGTTYGAGDGSTTFNLPDLRDRMPIGAGNLYSLNASGGSKDAIVPYHRHSVNAFTSGTPSTNTSGGMSAHSLHTHSLKGGAGTGTSDYPTLAYSYSGSTTGDNSMYSADLSHTHSLGNHTHSVGAHNTNYAGTSGNTTNANLPPYRGINFIIFAGV